MAMSSSSSSSVSPRFRTWPITATKSIEPMLREMGLKISADRIDGTTASTSSSSADYSGALSDALVSVGPAGRGGTGSFVSKDGLILTNWHVAYDAVRQASLKSSDGGRDYVEEGFVAKSREEEIQGPNYEVWITKSCKDVSDQVVAVIEKEPDPLKRANLVRDVTQEIAQKAQEEEEEGGGSSSGGGKRCDVQEMLPNESYVLFTYERLRDVRIVYVPPKSLGNFGGDTDNFEWPRHTADFTLLRAYVGPSGEEAAEYSPNNIPYDSSKARIPVQRNGAQEGDMVFLLGFPGSTMRYAPSSRLQYSDSVAVPDMVRDFTRKLQLIAQYETDSPEAALKLGNSKKGLANELKRSKGKLVMMRKLQLIQERKAEEEELCEKSGGNAKQQLQRLSEIYDTFQKDNPKSSALSTCRGIYAGSALLAAGHSLHEFLVIEKLKPDQEREASYRKRNLPFLFKRLAKRLGDVHVAHEIALIKDALAKLATTSELEIPYKQIVEILGNGDDDLDKVVTSSRLLTLDATALQQALADDQEEGNKKSSSDSDDLTDDVFVKCAAALWNDYKTERDTSKALLSERDALFAELLELQRKHGTEATIYPDCNGSLRISAGHVEGYQAADAVLHKPHTTLAGLFDKAAEAKLLNFDADSTSTQQASNKNNEFACPERLYEMLASASASASAAATGADDGGDDDVAKVPVCLLYSTDTVGGNSGSPVMNANGELVAINFDRQRQGLMNEFKWSKDYSRSIGVDIRYMLWLIGQYDGAKHLVEEMLQ